MSTKQQRCTTQELTSTTVAHHWIKNQRKWILPASYAVLQLFVLSSIAVADEVEAIFGAMVKGGNLVVQVKSRGCTDAGSFRVEVGQTKFGPDVTIFRKKSDSCSEQEKVVDIGFSLSSVGIAPGASIGVQNRLGFRP